MNASNDHMVAGLIGDRYEIIGLIASGGMGTVYRARDTVLDRTVAVKVLRSGVNDPEFAARFRVEATTAARLSHPGIVAVYDFGDDDDTPFMAMEFVDGQNLREVLNSRAVLSPDLAARVALEVATALEHARRAGIVHRDIKPENILVTTDGQVKVADFGLSRALTASPATQAGILMGTAHYLAPEQVSGESTDHRADLYSLGVVLYEMLTGRPPFSGDTTAIIALKRVAEDVPSPMARNPSVPRALDDIVARATARTPGARYATAGEMATALRAVVPQTDHNAIGALVHHTEAIPVLEHETVAVPLSRMRGRAERKSKSGRRRWLALVVVLALTAGAFVALGPMAQARVPRVVALAQRTATDRLRLSGFKVDAIVNNDSRVPAGVVISQQPDPGAGARRGSTVHLMVSLGPEMIPVTDVVGDTFAEAEKALVAAGFAVVRADAFNDAPKLTIATQDPSSGINLERGGTVTVTVSKGPEMAVVPDVRHDPFDTASRDVRARGFLVLIKKEINESVAKNLVISQSIAPLRSVRKGSTVVLLISLGPPLVAVPNLACKTKQQADGLIAARGFRSHFSGSGSRVVDQQPAPGSAQPKGSTITVLMGAGSFC